MSAETRDAGIVEAGGDDWGCPLCGEGPECACACAECGRVEPVEELRWVVYVGPAGGYLCDECIAPCGEHARDPDGDWRECRGCQREFLVEGKEEGR